jgi:hypothetical protein
MCNYFIHIYENNLVQSKKKILNILFNVLLNKKNVKKKKLHYFSIKSFFSPYWIESQDMYKTSHIPNMPLVSIRGGKNGRWTIFILITKANKRGKTNKRIRICSHYFIRQTKCLLNGIECSLPHKLQIITSSFKYNAQGDITVIFQTHVFGFTETVIKSRRFFMILTKVTFNDHFNFVKRITWFYKIILNKIQLNIK